MAAPAGRRTRVARVAAGLLLLTGCGQAAASEPGLDVAGPRIWAHRIICATDTRGYCPTVTHPAGVVPDAVVASLLDRTGTVTVTDLTAQTFRVRVAKTVSTAGAVSVWASTPVRVDVIATYTPAPASPSPTVPPSGSPASSASPSAPDSPPPPVAAGWGDTYRKWSNGPNPNGDPGYFPVGVWMQNPDRTYNGQTSAAAYKSIGVNLDVTVNGWPGCAWCPAMEDELIRTGWDVFPWVGGGHTSNTFPGIDRVKARTPLGSRVKAWTLDDEPDMRRWDVKATDVYPANFRQFGDRVRAADPSRPVYTNFGKAMAIYGWNGYHAGTAGGTGSYAGDMALYCQSSDIVSADFYGWTDPYEGSTATYRGAWTYGRVIDTIRTNCGADKLAWGFVEATHPWQETAPANNRVTPAQIESAVWNQVVHGANGVLYFAHWFDNTGAVVEDSLLRDPAVRARIAAVNASLHAIAPVLNTRSTTGQVSVTSTGGVPVTFMHKRHDGGHWIVAQADGGPAMPLSAATTATFTVPVESGTAEAVGEARTVPVVGGKLTDQFGAYGHHVYRIGG